MAEFADSAVGNEGQDTATDFQVEATDGGSVSLPDGFSLSDATFETDGSDLLLTGADGAQVTVEDFFAQDNPPELVTVWGTISINSSSIFLRSSSLAWVIALLMM